MKNIRRYEEWPEKGELVMVKIVEVRPNSAIVELEEYPGKKGMIHISEISSRWIKNIRDFVREGQKWVAKVLEVDKDRKHITLSIKRVSPSARREKQKEYNNEIKAEKWLKMIAKQLGKDENRIYEEIGFLLQKKFDLMYAAFEIAKEEGKEALIKEGVPTDWAEKMEEFAKEYIKEKEVVIRRELEIMSKDGRGIKWVREALLKHGKGERLELKYISSPVYYIRIKGRDYKECEKLLKDFVGKVDEDLRKHAGHCKLVGEIEE